MNVGSNDHQFSKGVGLLFFAHIMAIAVGAILTIIGLGMGVTMVLLPVGIPIGLAGVLLLAWGLWGWTKAG